MNATIPLEDSKVSVDTGALEAHICPAFDADSHDAEWTA